MQDGVHHAQQVLANLATGIPSIGNAQLYQRAQTLIIMFGLSGQRHLECESNQRGAWSDNLGHAVPRAVANDAFLYYGLKIQSRLWVKRRNTR